MLYEDNHLLVLAKPAGLPSQDDASGDLSAVAWAKHYLKTTYAKPGEVYVGLVHRLDRPTGGVLLLARTSKAAERLSRQFQQRTVRKTYWAVALAQPQPPQGRLTHHLLKLEGANVMKAFNQPKRGTTEAVLDYRVLSQRGGLSLVQVQPLTGRQHQIRVQLARIACPLAGDVKYGAPQPLPDGQIGLWAVQLQVVHPVTLQALHFTAPPPVGRAPWASFADVPTPEPTPEPASEAQSTPEPPSA